VEEYLGGVVAARGPDGRWYTLEEASGLPERVLCRKFRWLLFLPPDWRKRQTRRWEERQKERAARGETDYAWTATEDPAEAERARQDLRGGGSPDLQRSLFTIVSTVSARSGSSSKLTWPSLRVSKMAVSSWEAGPEPDEEDGKVRGKPIPEALRPLLVRWIETGEVPTPKELAARRTRRTGLQKTPPPEVP